MIGWRLFLKTYLNQNLSQQPQFVYDENGRITGYKTKAGADAVFPFFNGCKLVLHGHMIARYGVSMSNSGDGKSYYDPEYIDAEQAANKSTGYFIAKKSFKAILSASCSVSLRLMKNGSEAFRLPIDSSLDINLREFNAGDQFFITQSSNANAYAFWFSMYICDSDFDLNNF